MQAQGYYEKGQKYYIFADIANVRSSPDLNGPVISKLPAGNEITVEDKGIADKVGDYEGLWFEVTYTSDSKENKGYIWSGALSHTQMRRGNIKFVYGADREKTVVDNEIPFELKVLKDDNIVFRKAFLVPSGSLSYTEGKIKPNGNLSSIEYIVDLYFTGEACGYGNYHYNFGWTGSELLELPYTLSIGDSGLYSYGEYLIYPGESQLPHNMMLKVIEEGSAPDENSDIEYHYKTLMYQWDGRKASLVKLEQ